MDPLQQLSKALEQRNLQFFEDSLRINTNPNVPDSNGITIYEKALSTAGCGDFIGLCLRYGCKADYLNQRKKKAAINFASDSRDSENVRILLEHQGVQVDNQYNNLTPLNSLAKGLNVDNVSQVKECMSLLLRYGASPNIADDSAMTPLHYVLNNNKIELHQKQELIDLLLQHPDIYLDDELRKDLPEFNPKLVLRPNPKPKAINSIEILSNVEEFKRMLLDYTGDRLELVEKCITSGCHESFDHLLTEPFDINGKSEENGKTCVEIALIYGNWYTLEKLLQHKDLRLDRNLELLHRSIGRLDEKPQTSYSDYVKCFHVLVASEHIDVNEKDRSGRTPIHYAIIYNHELATKDVLRHGAYLGVTSSFNELVIEDIDPKLLEKHFDDCITSDGRNRADKQFRIRLNYKSLRLPNNMESKSESESNELSEMEPICAMAKSKNLRHLLDHPLIKTLTVFKWRKISMLFNTYVVVSALLNIMLMANIFLNHYKDVSPIVASLLQLISWISIVCFVICEAFSIYITRLMWPMSRVLNLSLILLSIISNLVSNSDKESYYSRVFAAFAILSIAVKLTQLLGSLHLCSLSIYVLMLREVTYNFLKSCIPYSILVVSFGLSFYVLNFHNLSEQPVVNAIMKTIDMSTGEFNENDIAFQKVYDRLFLNIFVVFIAIVLMNLLSALAFSDIQAIKASAEVHSLMCLVNLLSFYEMCLRKLGRFSQKMRVNLPEVIFVFPNDIEIQTDSKASYELVPLIQGENKLESNMRDDQCILKMKNSEIKHFLQLIDLKAKSEFNRQLISTTTNKLEKIEKMLGNLLV